VCGSRLLYLRLYLRHKHIHSAISVKSLQSLPVYIHIHNTNTPTHINISTFTHMRRRRRRRSCRHAHACAHTRIQIQLVELQRAQPCIFTCTPPYLFLTRAIQQPRKKEKEKIRSVDKLFCLLHIYSTLSHLRVT